ncbi:MAG: hypothetical protein HOP07_04660 [Bacteriovoracaceae bacterium]|nr:hypothetical protein [Bacteriovoracaceae bacterium]
MFSMFKSSKIVELKLPMPLIKERANILFIDNEKVELIETLQLEGWHVEYWDDVKSLKDLEEGKFDIIFLDIGGVGKAYAPTEEGFGILTRLKSVNPTVCVVAYSGMSFDASKAQFWAKADASLSKSAGAIDAIELLEELLTKKYNSKVLWDDFKSILKINHATDKQIELIQNAIFIDSKNSNKLEKLKVALSTISLSASTMGSLITIGTKIYKIIEAVAK